ncbi:MAG: B12-binding domain-containing radical SAM protein [Planctomycetota bacterium]
MSALRIFRLVIPRHPAINIYTRVADKTTALGPVQVATLVSHLPGWDVEVIDENNYHAPGPLDDEGLPDHARLQAERPACVVGFYGGLTSTVPRLYHLALSYAGMGVATVGGGQHLDKLPDEALASGLDVVVHGEGEQAMIELLDAFDANAFRPDALAAIAGISYLAGEQRRQTAPRPPCTDFEHQPLPDFGLLRFAHMSIYPVSRTRGCGQACEFCTVRGRPRSASAAALLRQVARLVETRQARDFFIVDDHFAEDRDETLAFCHMLAAYRRRLGVRLFITVQIRLDLGGDSELLEAMADAGVRIAAIGIESPIDADLQAMRKGMDSQRMVELVHGFHRAGIMVHGMFIFAYPARGGQPAALGLQERIKAYRRFFRRSHIDTIQVLLAIPLPGTPFRTRMQREGRVVEGGGVGWEHYDGAHPLAQPDAPLTIEDLHLAQNRLMGGFYRFGSLFGLLGCTMAVPLLAPWLTWRGRWRSFQRVWRKQLISVLGSLVMSRWRREFRRSPFPVLLRTRSATLS